MKKFLYLIPLLLICSYANAQTWQPHPGRTTAQQTAGLDGFEGSQWQKVIEFAPSDANVVYAGIDTSSVWKSIDGGANWTPKSKGLYGQDIRGIAIDPNNANNVCVATRDGILALRGEYSTGIYRTTDGGNNWTYELFREVGYPTGFGWFDAVVWNGTSNALYCSTNATGIYKSMDNGDTWNTLRSSGTDTFSGVWGGHVCLDPTDVNTIYVCAISGTTSTGLHKITMAAGSTTVTSHQYLSASKAGTSPAWKAYKTANGNIYISRRTGDTRGIYRSTNGGSTFSAINSGITNLTTYPLDYFEVSSNGLRAAVTQSDRYGNGSYWYCNDITASTPTWLNPSSTDLQNANGWIAGSLVTLTQAVFASGRPTAFHPTNNNIMLSCTQFDIFQKSTDGGVIWTPSSGGYNGVCKAIASLDADNTVFCFDRSNANRWLKGAADYSARYTTNGGSTYKSLWNYINFVNGRKDTYAVALQPGGTAAILAVGSIGYQNLQRTANIDAVSPIFSVVQPTLNTYHAIYWNGSNTTKVYARNQISTDSGATFSTIAGGRSVDSMHPQNNNVVYDLVQSGGNILIYKSTDAASSWTQPFAAAPTVAGDVVCQFTVDPFDQNRCYVGVRPRGIYVITTSSATLVTSGLAKSMVGNYDYQSLACDPTQQGVIYAGAASSYSGINAAGVYRSLDSGITWSSYNGNIDYPRNIFTLAVNPHNGKVFANGFHGTVVADPNYSPPPPDPVGGLPSVSTGTATSVTSTTATLQGSVNPNSLDTTYRWQYNTADNSWGTATNTGSQTVSSSYGTQSVGVTQGISGLIAGTTYFNRIQAKNGSGSVSGSTTTFATLSSRKLFEVSKVGTSAITIDGDLSEWGTLENSIPNIAAGSPVSSGTWSARWIDGSAGGLYLAIQVSDSNQYADSGTSTPYQDDSVEYYIDRDNNKGSTYDSYDRNIKFVYGSSSTLTVNTGTTTGILLAGSNTASTWTKEVFIPWSLFPGGVVPSTGTIIGFDTQLNDDNNGGSREGDKFWNNTVDTNYYDTSNFGEIELAGYPAPPASPCSVSSSNLVAHFAMNESSGTTVADHSLKNNTGTITGALFTSGKIGNALDFDGVDDYVSFPNESYYDFNRTDSFSVTAWIKVATSTTNTYYLVSKVFGGTPYNGWTMAVDYDAPATGYLLARLCYSYNANLLEKQSSVRVDSNTWRHVAFTFAGTSTPSGLNVYVDGALSNGTVTYNSLSLSILNNQALVIGKFAAGGAPTDGLIDDVRIYDKVLSADEISCIYNDTTPLSVASTIPGSASAGIALDTNVDITFNEALDTSWAGTSTFTVGTVTGSVSQGTGTLQFNPTSNLNIATTYPVTLSSKLRDATGNVMLDNYIYTFTTLIGTDTTAPVGTVTLHNGATYATDQAITIDLTATDGVGVVGYFLSEGSTTPYATQTGWVAIATTTSYSEEIPYTLSVIDGLKTLYAWFKDTSDNVSTKTQDSITLDTSYTSISIGTPTSNTNLYTDGSKVYGTTGSFINMGGNAFDTNLVTQVKINNNNTSTINTAEGTETWSANNQRVICALDDGLVFYAKLDEPNGAAQTLDSSIYGVVGSNTGSVIGTTSVFGHSRYFDGVDDYVDFGNQQQYNFGTSSFSLSFWWTPRGINPSVKYIVSCNQSSGTGGFAIYEAETNIHSVWDFTSGRIFGNNVATNIATGTPVFICCVVNQAAYPNGTVRTFANDVQTGTSSSIGTGTINFPTNLTFCSQFTPSNFNKGTLDDVRMYNRALSQSEITQLYQLTTPEIDNTFSATGFDTPGNQGTDTIRIGNYPVPVTGTATNIGTVTVTLNGNLIANLGNTCTAFFEYSTTSDSYVGSSSTYVVNAPGTTTEKPVSISLSGLIPATEYFYRLAASNDIGTTVSYESSFTTDELPNDWSVVTGGRWVYYSQFHKTDFLVFLKSVNRYHSFRKHIRSSKDWVELMANPDSKLSSLPID